MTINSRGLASLAAMSLVFAVAGCKKKDAAAVDTMAMAAPVDAMPAVPAPVHVTDVSTGKGLTADKNLVTATSDFGVRDTIYVVVKTEGAATSAKLDAKWTYNGKQTVNTSSQNIAPTGPEAREEFHIKKAGAWPKGAYKVEIMLDGASAGSKDFTIK
ncbi:MAG: hypothetical protein ABIZ36_07415 [Gemmatimonadaceae bacterium]